MKSNQRCSQELSAPVLAMMKRRRTCVKSFQQQQTQSTEPEFYLPDDCWEHVFSFIINPLEDSQDKNKLNFKSLSLVSKGFLSITNRFIFSLTIYYPQLCYLPRFFHRFSNLHSLDLWFGSHHLDAAIALALRNRSTLKSLSISRIELKVAKYETSHYIDSLVSLKGLNYLKFWCSQISDDLLYSIARESLPLKTFVLENCTSYSYHGIYDLLTKCHGIQHLGLQGVDFLNDHLVSRLSLLLPDLVSINLSGCSKLTNSALFAFIKNCHSLAKITMQQIDVERDSVENSFSLQDFDVNPQLKFLRLSGNSFINDEIIILFASIFPNLELLDLSYCHGNISERGISQILNRCCKVRHVNLIRCEDVRGFKLNYVLHELEVLNLSATNVDDETLYEISKSCCGLLQLLLVCCEYVTNKGVVRVIENCLELEEIYLRRCDKVNVDVVVSILSSSPSLKGHYPTEIFL